MIGKSGVAVNSDNVELPNNKGFDYFFGFLAHVGTHRYYPKVLYRNGEEIQYPQNEVYTGEVYSGDVILDDALRYLDGQSVTGKPFFLHLALQQPHADLAVPDEFLTLFYFNFIKTNNPRPDNCWSSMIDSPVHRTWTGYAFERVCMEHIPQN